MYDLTGESAKEEEEENSLFVTGGRMCVWCACVCVCVCVCVWCV